MKKKFLLFCSIFLVLKAFTQTIATGTVPLNICVGSTVNVPFTLTGSFNSGNVFTAELSDATGAFSAPLAIGALTSTIDGTIVATIPLLTPSGNAYRIRVTSSDPVITGSDNGVDISINALSTVTHVVTDVLCNSGITGAINLTVSGALPCTFDWGGITTEDRTGLSAGIYSVSVTDANSCTTTASITVNQPSAISVSVFSVNVSCFGGNNGSIDLTVSGGTSPYTYDWNSGTYTTEDLTGLTEGVYSGVLTDGNGCTESGSVTITEPTALIATSTAPGILCNGGTATVTVSASGGTGPYTGTGAMALVSAGPHTYTVTDANSCTTITNITVTQPSALVATSSAPGILCNGGTATVTVAASGGTSPYTGTGAMTLVSAGPHTYTVTDANSCTSTTNITVIQPSVLVATSSAPAILCNGGTTTVTVSASGGTGPYTGTGAITGVTAGSHTYTVTDANSCTTTTSITVTQPSAISVSVSSVNVSCFGGNNGSIDLSVSGGTSPYTFDWNSGTYTTEDLTGLTAGVYSGVLTDGNGCTDGGSVTITEPAALVATSSAPAILCFGGTTTVTIIATGGTGPYSGVGVITGVTAGTHTYTVTDNKGCSTTTSITLTQPAAALASTSSSTMILCNGGNSTITVSATGGTLPYTGTGIYTVTAGPHTYLVTDNNGCSSSTSITVTQPSLLAATSTSTLIDCNGGTATVTVAASGGIGPYSGTGSIFSVSAGTHVYTVTDDNGCSGTTSITITQPAVLVATSTSTPILCNGGNSTVTVSATGGVGPYTGTGTFTETAGTHLYLVSASPGCSTSTSITITDPSALIISAASQTEVSCFNGSNGAASVSVTGGTVPYSYNWTPGNPTGDGTNSVTGLSAASYTCTVTDANSCTSSQVFTISQPIALAASSIAVSPILCNGGSTSVSVSATGGTSPYTGIGLYTQTAGSITYTVTDANSCSTTTNITLTQPTPILLSSSFTPILCFGGNSSLTVAASGGTPPYTGTGTFSFEAGPHAFVVTDDNGCLVSAISTIPEPAELTASFVSIDATCNINNGSTTITVNGGTPSYSYSWSTSAGTSTNETLLAAGSHSCTVQDGNGCISSFTYGISNAGAPTVSLSSQVDVLCNGGNNGSATVSATGGSPGYTYLWSPIGGTGATGINLPAGTYVCEVKDIIGCIETQSVIINEPTELIASSSSTAIACNGGTAVITVSALGGTAPYIGTGNFTVTAGTYSYTVTDDHNCTSITNITVSEPTALVATSTSTVIDCYGGLSSVGIGASGGTAPYTAGPGSYTVPAGTYTYSVSDANSCSATTTITISEPAELIASSTAPAIACNGGTTTITISATGGTTLYGGTGSIPSLSAGTYSFTVNDAHGCTSTTNITISEPPILSAMSSSTSIACNGGSGLVTLIGSGGTSPYFATGPFSQTAGTVIYTISDANSCNASVGVTLTEPSMMSISLAFVGDVSCYGGTDGLIDINVTGGSAPYTYNWNSGTFSTEDISGLAMGSYAVVITDANGCTDGGNVNIGQPIAPLTSSVTSSASPTLCGATDGAIDITVAGGTVAYLFVWSNGDLIEDLSNVGAGSYNVTITDANNCTSTETVTLNDPSAPIVTLTLPITIVCQASSTFILTGESPVGGTFSGPGVTTATGSFTPSAASPGVNVISYTYTDGSGCTGVTTGTIFVDLCTEIASSSNSAVVRVFPNPTSGILNVETSNDKNLITIFDLLGNKVFSVRSFSKNTEIEMQNMANGIYFIKVESEQSVEIIRIVKSE